MSILSLSSNLFNTSAGTTEAAAASPPCASTDSDSVFRCRILTSCLLNFYFSKFGNDSVHELNTSSDSIRCNIREVSSSTVHAPHQFLVAFLAPMLMEEANASPFASAKNLQSQSAYGVDSSAKDLNFFLQVPTHICFQGSQSVADWWSNLQAASFYSLTGDTHGRVHHGFYTTASRIPRDPFLELINLCKTKFIFKRRPNRSDQIYLTAEEAQFAHPSANVSGALHQLDVDETLYKFGILPDFLRQDIIKFASEKLRDQSVNLKDTSRCDSMSFNFAFELTFSGHSRGGAIAQLVALLLLKDLPVCDLDVLKQLVHVVAFGAPLVGDELFCSDATKVLKSRAHFFVHGEDCVPKLLAFLSSITNIEEGNIPTVRFQEGARSDDKICVAGSESDGKCQQESPESKQNTLIYGPRLATFLGFFKKTLSPNAALRNLQSTLNDYFKIGSKFLNGENTSSASLQSETKSLLSSSQLLVYAAWAEVILKWLAKESFRYSTYGQYWQFKNDKWCEKPCSDIWTDWIEECAQSGNNLTAMWNLGLKNIQSHTIGVYKRFMKEFVRNFNIVGYLTTLRIIPLLNEAFYSNMTRNAHRDAIQLSTWGSPSCPISSETWVTAVEWNVDPKLSTTSKSFSQVEIQLAIPGRFFSFVDSVKVSLYPSHLESKDADYLKVRLSPGSYDCRMMITAIFPKPLWEDFAVAASAKGLLMPGISLKLCSLVGAKEISVTNPVFCQCINAITSRQARINCLTPIQIIKSAMLMEATIMMRSAESDENVKQLITKNRQLLTFLDEVVKESVPSQEVQRLLKNYANVKKQYRKIKTDRDIDNILQKMQEIERNRASAGDPTQQQITARTHSFPLSYSSSSDLPPFASSSLSPISVSTSRMLQEAPLQNRTRYASSSSASSAAADGNTPPLEFEDFAFQLMQNESSQLDSKEDIFRAIRNKVEADFRRALAKIGLDILDHKERESLVIHELSTFQEAFKELDTVLLYLNKFRTDEFRIERRLSMANHVVLIEQLERGLSSRIMDSTLLQQMKFNGWLMESAPALLNHVLNRIGKGFGWGSIALGVTALNPLAGIISFLACSALFSAYFLYYQEGYISSLVSIASWLNVLDSSVIKSNSFHAEHLENQIVRRLSDEGFHSGYDYNVNKLRQSNFKHSNILGYQSVTNFLKSVYVIQELRNQIKCSYNFGIIGESRCGKSQLLKSFGFATNAGHDYHTTTLKCYTFPGLSCIRFLDFPGHENAVNEISTIFADCFPLCDAFIVIGSASNPDSKFISNAVAMAVSSQRPVLFLLNKADEILFDEKKVERGAFRSGALAVGNESVKSIHTAPLPAGKMSHHDDTSWEFPRTNNGFCPREVNHRCELFVEISDRIIAVNSLLNSIEILLKSNASEHDKWSAIYAKVAVAQKSLTDVAEMVFPNNWMTALQTEKKSTVSVNDNMEQKVENASTNDFAEVKFVDLYHQYLSNLKSEILCFVPSSVDNPSKTSVEIQRWFQACAENLDAYMKHFETWKTCLLDLKALSQPHLPRQVVDAASSAAFKVTAVLIPLPIKNSQQEQCLQSFFSQSSKCIKQSVDLLSFTSSEYKSILEKLRTLRMEYNEKTQNGTGPGNSRIFFNSYKQMQENLLSILVRLQDFCERNNYCFPIVKLLFRELFIKLEQRLKLYQSELEVNMTGASSYSLTMCWTDRDVRKIPFDCEFSCLDEQKAKESFVGKYPQSIHTIHADHAKFVSWLEDFGIITPKYVIFWIEKVLKMESFPGFEAIIKQIKNLTQLTDYNINA